MITTTNTIKLAGIEGVTVKVECLIDKGIGIHLVGLADQAVKQSLLRLVTAQQALGYRIPGKRIVINLAPADLTKSGAGYDLPIALAMLAASGQEDLPSLESSLVVGELALDGLVRAVPGAVQALDCAKRGGFARLILPYQDAVNLLDIAGLNASDGISVHGVRSLPEAVAALKGEFPCIWDVDTDSDRVTTKVHSPSWNKISGNAAARRALEIAAAGGHHMLLVGAPGCQKPEIGKALTELLGPLTPTEYRENAAIWSAADRLSLFTSLGRERSFRAPHYSSSIPAVIGGGQGDTVRPGEVTLANHGVLFLDDITDFPKSSLEALRAPLEDGQVTISRLRNKVTFPTRFQLVAAMNPCPCGYYGEGDRCTCTPRQKEVYLSRLSGPLYDRIDMQVFIHKPVKEEPGQELAIPEDLELVRERIEKARQIQKARLGPGRLNADMNSRETERYCRLSDELKDLIEKLFEHLGLSALAYSRILKIARTIADLAGHEEIMPADISEATSYRFLDRKSFD